MAEMLRAEGTPFVIGDLRRSDLFPDYSTRVDVRRAEDVLAVLREGDLVVNLAAVHRDDVRPPSLYAETNVGGAVAVVDACESRNVRTIVFTSSVAVYGHVAGVADEEYPCRPANAYGQSKLAAEQVYRQWYNRDDGRHLSVIRPTVVFGEGNRGNVFSLLQQVSRRFLVMIGDGANRKSIAYVGNVARAVLWLSTRGSGEFCYNYVDEPVLSMMEVIELVRSELKLDPRPRLRMSPSVALALGRACDILAQLPGVRLPLTRARVEKFQQATCFEARRIREAGFTPQFDLRAALLETVRHEFGRLAALDSGLRSTSV